MTDTVTDDTWRARISAARERREPYEAAWKYYCQLHFDSERSQLSGGFDSDVELPSGDSVRLGLVFRNIEQTMGYLEMDDIGVTARAMNYTRPLDNIDTSNEAVVEQAVYESMTASGLVKGPDRLDRLKLDALLVGHAVSYSWWKTVEEEIEVARVPMLVEQDGQLTPQLDDQGHPAFKKEIETRTVWEGMVDERISPLEFLISSTASSIDESHWLGFEKIVRLDELKQDGRYGDIPEDLTGGSYELQTLQGERSAGGSNFYMEDSVKVVTVWDRASRELVTFLDSTEVKDNETSLKEQTGTALGEPRFHRLSHIQYPVSFDNPQDSPFATYVPIPANDHPFGISQVEHIKNPSLASDTLFTRFTNLSREQKRLWLYDKNKLESDQVEQVRDSKKSLEVLGLDVQDSDDISRIFKDHQTINIPDSLLNAATLNEDIVRKNSGVAETPFGGTETATESENQMMIGQARVNRKRSRLFSFMERIAQIHLAFLRTFAPDGSSIRVTLADGTETILSYGREAFAGRFHIKVEPGGGPTAISPVRQKMLLEAVGMVGNTMGPKASLLLYREVLTQMDVRNVNGILQAAKEFLMPPPPPVPPPGATPPPGAPVPPGGMPAGMPLPPPPGAAPPMAPPGQTSNPNELAAAVNVTR